MRGTGRPTQLPGRVRKESATLGAFWGFEHHLGGVMAVSGGGRTTTPPTWCWTPISASKGVILTRIRPGNWVGRPAPRTSTFFILTTRLQLRSRRRHERVPLRTATTALRPKLKSCAEEKKLRAAQEHDARKHSGPKRNRIPRRQPLVLERRRGTATLRPPARALRLLAAVHAVAAADHE